MSEKILVVDDEPMVREVVVRYLRREGYSVSEAADGISALDATRRDQPDLLILDLMLPQLDGLEVCRRIQADWPIPVIMLTAKGEESDKILGLGLGADDYLTKPFSPLELVARVKAVLRRAETTTAPAVAAHTIRHGDLRINPRTREVEVGGRRAELTAKEFDLLHFLARHPRQVFSRDQLLDRVWDQDYFGESSTVTVHVRRLREKVEPDPNRPSRIKTVWGVGYKFEP